MKIWFTGDIEVLKDGITFEYGNPKTRGLLLMLTDTKGSLLISTDYGLQKLCALGDHLKPDSWVKDFSDDNVLTEIDPSEPIELMNFKIRESAGKYKVYPRRDYQFNGRRITDIVSGFNAKAVGLGLNVKLDQSKFGVKASKCNTKLRSGDLEAGVCSSPYINTLGKELFMDSDITQFKCGSGLMTIGSCCFIQSKLAKITFNESLVHIDNFAFQSCQNLTELIFPKSLRSIGFFSMKNCDNLRYLELNDGLQFTCDAAVQDCERLREIKINLLDPIMISSRTFANCGIRKVSLHRGIANNEQIKNLILRIRMDAKGPVKVVLFG